MKKLTLMVLLLLVPQLAAARIYRCVDPATGRISFTDQACDTASVREEIRVLNPNLDSGRGHAVPATRETWRSQRTPERLAQNSTQNAGACMRIRLPPARNSTVVVPVRHSSHGYSLTLRLLFRAR